MCIQLTLYRLARKVTMGDEHHDTFGDELREIICNDEPDVYTGIAYHLEQMAYR